ncbi:MAG: hypothetical protein AB1767_05305 [Bacillota bacterium]
MEPGFYYTALQSAGKREPKNGVTRRLPGSDALSGRFHARQCGIIYETLTL